MNLAITAFVLGVSLWIIGSFFGSRASQGVGAALCMLACVVRVAAHAGLLK